MPIQPSFSIRIEMEESLTVDEIWPDGNAPENPTVADVEAVFFKDRYNMHNVAKDWGFEIAVDDITITDNAALIERIESHKAAVAARAERKNPPEET